MSEMWTDAMSDDFHRYCEAFTQHSQGKLTSVQMDAALARWKASAACKFIWDSVKPK